MFHGLQDINGIQVPVSSKFRKGSLLSCNPVHDDVDRVYFVVNWLDRVIRVVGRHGAYTTDAEFSGEEWTLNITSAVICEPENGEWPSLKEQQEIALEVARYAQSYLRVVPEITEEVKEIISRLLNPAAFVIGARSEDGMPLLPPDEFDRMRREIQNEAWKRAAQFLNEAS